MDKVNNCSVIIKNWCQNIKNSNVSYKCIIIFINTSCSHSVTSDCLQSHGQPGSSSMGFSRQEYWSELPVLSPGDLLDPRIKPKPPTLQADSLPCEPPGKPYKSIAKWKKRETIYLVDCSLKIGNIGKNKVFYIFAETALSGLLLFADPLFH